MSIEEDQRDRDRGYNPMRHECQQQGCYIEQCRPKSEWFADCFPGKISFSDLDRIVEISGRGLIFEWKYQKCDMPTGQDIMWKRLTRGKLLTVFCAAGDVSEMEIEAYAFYFNGVWHQWKDCGLMEFSDKIKSWVRWAQEHSLIDTEFTP